VTGITSDWRRIRVPLNVMNGIADWKHLRQFTLAFQPRRSPVTAGAYWLDDIALIKTGQPGPNIRDPVATPRKDRLEAMLGNRAAVLAQLPARLAGWPARLTVEPAELPTDDRAFLERLARDTWRGLAALSDREHGLPLDTVRFDGAIAPDRVWLGDYTNITNIGLYLIDIVAARELGLIGPDEARVRLDRTLDTLERLETWRGFHYNYYDTTTWSPPVTHLVRDSTWLTAGLIVVRTASRTGRAVRPADRPRRLPGVLRSGRAVDDARLLRNLPYRSEYSYGLLYSEARLGSLIAIGKGDAPAEHWYRMARTFPRYFTWQSQPPGTAATRP